MKKLTALFLALLLFMACQTPTKMFEKGQYHHAFKHYANKVDRAHSKTTHIQGLELAFHAANDQALQDIDSLNNLQEAAQWLHINHLHRQIHTRQEILRPMLPIRSKSGYTGQFWGTMCATEYGGYWSMT